MPNVRGHLLPLAFGTKGCSAADVPKVPKAWELGGPLRSAYSVEVRARSELITSSSSVFTFASFSSFSDGAS